MELTMKSSIDEIYSEIENHDCAVVKCDGSEKFVRAVMDFFFSVNAYSYNIYKIDYINNSDKENISVLYIIVDIHDKKCLESSLYRAKIAYQLKDTLFIQNGSKIDLLIFSKEINLDSITLNQFPQGVFMLMALSDSARREMIVKIPWYLNDSQFKRYVELNNSIVVSPVNGMKPQINKELLPKYSHEEELLEFRNPSVRHSSDTSATRSLPMARLHTAILGGSPQVEALEKIAEKLKSETGIEMVLCPKGSFVMGSPEDEIGRINDYCHNENQKEIIIPKPFMIGAYLTVIGQFELLADQNLLSDCNVSSNSDYRKYKLNPVNLISYNNAVYFCELLNKKFADLLPNNYKFSLPTESQWEYACRAGTTTAFNNGKNTSKSDEDNYKALDEIAWFENNSSLDINDTKFIRPVGLKKSNAWGVYDMHGTLYEWCINDQNRKNESYQSFAAIGKGGSYINAASYCRSASWLGFNKRDEKFDFVGFRLALVPTNSN